MKVKFISLASGSSGNCYYIGTEKYGILIDAGIAVRTIKKGLKEAGISMEMIRAVFVTHDHADHIKAVGGLGEKLNIPIYTTARIHEGINRSYCMTEKLYSSVRYLEKQQPMQLEDFHIESFEVPHDGTDNVGYCIEIGGKVFAFLTDLGEITPTAAEYIRKANYLILEANYDDEMLRMGFIEDVETIMAQIPEGHQTALFSATMPEAIRRITRRFMKEPQEVRIQSSVTTRPDISQSYWTVWGMRKNEALVRFLEAEDFDAAIIFVRTKNATLEVAEALERNGYNSAALNGDMNQALREQTLERLKDGRLDILIATDVAARGLDVERISLVVNYDIPMDSESYVHRIGRTGRAGRAGRALLFVENRERRLLRNIERTMKLTIPEVELPNAELLGKRRLEKFAAKVQQQLESSDLDQYRALLSKIQPTAEGEELDLETLTAALLKMAQGERTLIVPPDAPMRPKREFRDRDDRGPRDRNDRGPRGDREDRPRRERRDVGDMQLYRIEVGRDDGVEVRHIVGAIANEGDISSRYIGNIKLFASHSTIELPKGMPGEVLQHFTRTRILNKPMNMQLLGDAQPHTGGERRGGGRGFGGERREGGRNFSGERREGGRGDGRRFSGERREGRAPRRDDSTGRRRFGGDA